MKILYAIQGTGNGHISRARDIIPVLQQHGQLDLLVSGIQADVGLECPIRYRLKGLSFVFGKSGGVDIWNTFYRNRSAAFNQEMRELPVEQYDLIINDFEPISAWAAHFKHKPVIGLSHQAAVLAPGSPRPKRTDFVGRFILENYAPASVQYGFHFDRFGPNIYMPVIRKQIRALEPSNQGHYTVYLPAYSEEKLISRLGKIKGVRWEIFSKHSQQERSEGNLHIRPVNNDLFVRSLATCEGILCGAGFETPAEALFLGKKLLVIPMKGQYEQQCNAAALAAMGVPVVSRLKKKFLPLIQEWVENGKPVQVNYPDETEAIISRIVAEHGPGTARSI